MATGEPGTVTEPRDEQQGLALLFGVVLVLLGIIDYSGVLVSDSRLLGVFSISPLFNLVHVLTGLLGVVLSTYAGAGALFNKLGGIIYFVVFIGGTGATVAGSDNTNWATNGLHLLLSVVVAAVGFGVGESRPR